MVRVLGRTVIRWVLPLLSLVVAGSYVWAAVVWQANPAAIPIVGHSMQPNIWAGDLVVVRAVEPTSLEVGDVITIRVPETDRATWGMPQYVTHRIVKIDRAAGASGLRFHTRGDNNKADDPFLTRGPSVHGKEVLRIPKLGMVVLFFMSRQGLYSVAGFALLGILWLLVGRFERRRLEEEDSEATLRAVLDEVRQVSTRPDSPSGTDSREPLAVPVASPPMAPRGSDRSGRSPSHPAVAAALGSSVPTDAPASSTVAVHRPAPAVHPGRDVVVLPPLAVEVGGLSIIVTGATGAMGGAIARALHAAGARLTLTGRDPERLQELVEELPGALVVRADLLRPEMPEKLVERALRAHGQVHGLVNAASAGEDGHLLGASDAVLGDVLAANVMLPIRLIRAAAPHLETGGFVCNLGARPPAVRGHGATVQATARATMAVMTSVLEWELADRGVRMLDMLADAPVPRVSRAVTASPIVPTTPSVTVETPTGAITSAEPPGSGSPVAAPSDAAADEGEDPPAPPSLRVVR